MTWKEQLFHTELQLLKDVVCVAFKLWGRDHLHLATVLDQSPSCQVRRTFPLHPLAHVSHLLWIRDIKWFPTLGRTSMYHRTSPLTTTSICSQSCLSEPQTTPEASPEHPPYCWTLHTNSSISASCVWVLISFVSRLQILVSIGVISILPNNWPEN